MSIDRIERHRVVVVGSGVAGLSTALALGDCLVLTKTPTAWGGSTAWAQGGIAVPLGPGDSPSRHAVDTIAVSGGIGDAAMAHLLTADAAGRIAELIARGARFDRGTRGELVLGREAGHRSRRIVHANGDATGAEVMRTLTAAVAARADITVAAGEHALDLVRSGNRIVGVFTRDAEGTRVVHLAGAVVIATGGIGQLYSRTTNPPEVTGDGIAMAARAGAALADMEFVQFHPTALDVDVATVPLLTEALRGEGAVLVDGTGRRFMTEVHPDAELAPRDVVARAIWARRAAETPVFLDATAAVGDDFPHRFPTVFDAAKSHGIDPRRQPMPVTPAVHYFMGGIAVDDVGRTSVPGLWAVGEAASTGVHGANRLASNSLLEGLVFGARVAAGIAGELAPTPTEAWLELPEAALAVTDDDPGELARIRRAMWEGVGIVRNAAGLRRALLELAALADSTGELTRNAVTVGRWMARAALDREESRGGHFREDHPQMHPELADRSLVEPDPATSAAVVVTEPQRHQAP